MSILPHVIASFAMALMDPRLLTLVVLGAALGILGGAMPGLSAPGALAIVLPFTFGMSALEGVSFLTAVYTGAQYGGSITATLFNTPGAPESAVMTLDGFALTTRGFSRKALEGTLWAGLIGGFVGIAVLVLFLVPVAALAVRFGPTDYASLALLGFTAMSGIAGKSRAKAMAASMFGLLLGTVGLDPITALPRYTFGLPVLFSGFPLIPVLIGLFAVSEGLILTGRGLAAPRIAQQRPVHFTMREFREHFRAMMLGSGVGTMVGVLPGGGASVASWLAYSVSRIFSRESARFGQGALDGLLAPEAADKAIVGAALIPLLTLGVPSTAGASVLIGGFEIHNIVPGPTLLTSQGALVFGVLATLVISNLAVFGWGRLFIGSLLRVRSVQPAVLGIGVIVVSMLGAYAYNSIVFSIVLTVAFGIVGYLLRRSSVPVAPIILGMIIGPIFDENLRRALISSGGSLAPFVSNPVSLVLLVLALALAVLPTLLNRRTASPDSRREA